MKFTGLECTADMVGHRVRVRWGYSLDVGEAAGSLPDVLLRRKLRDFDFPPLVPSDPYLVYDSAAFPPAPIPNVLAVVDLPPRERFENGMRITRTGISVARVVDGRPEEILREVTESRYDGQGRPVAIDIELVHATGLPPQETLYYELDDGAAPAPEQVALYRDTAVPGALHGHNRDLWELVPETYRSRDVVQLADEARVPGLHETGGTGGQLRRFIDMFGLGFDLLRNSAEALSHIRDVDQAPPAWLDLLGKGIGWQPSETVPLPRRRNEVRSATRLYAVNGTAQSLRTLVTQQTGWRSQIAELADNVTRANVAPKGNLYFQREIAAGVWRGGLDCAATFAFPAAPATGSGVLPAILESAASEPFALRAGEEVTLAIDGNVPVRIRFARADFADIGAATAAEVVTVVNRLLDSVEASDQAGALRLTTMLTGPDASIAVLPERQSLLSVSELPAGALAPAANAAGGIDLFYRDEQRFVADGPSATPSRRANRILQKSWGYGLWRDAAALPRWTKGAEDVDACAVQDGVSLVLWSSASGLALARGIPSASLPATLASRSRQPFALAAGLQLSVETEAGIETFTANPADYADITAATALEVAAAISAQLANAAATAQPDGSLRLASIAAGSQARLGVDLAQSTAAHALGLAARELEGRGHWSPARDWQGPLPGPVCWNLVADPAIVAPPTGGSVAAWAENTEGAWQIRTAHRDERLALATAAGVAERPDASSPWAITLIADGLPSDNVRMVLGDAQGGKWFATDNGLALRRADDVWQSFNTGDGLVSNDIRAIALLPSGAIACATPAGLSELAPDGAVTNTLATPDGMISSDLHAIAAPGTGDLWVGTSAGIGRRTLGGRWTWWGATSGVSAGPITALVLAPSGAAAAGSSSGVLLFDGARWADSPIDPATPALAIRALARHPDGTLLAATPSGLGRYRDRRWSLLSTFSGLPTNDLTAIGWQQDGKLLLGTPSGLLVENAGPGWTILGAVDGLAASPVLHIAHGWSAPQIVAASPGGDREPHLVVETSDEIWLVWAHRENAVATLRDDWTLQLSRLDPATGWSAPAALTTPLAGGSADRRPRALADPLGGIRVAFATDRNGASQTALLPVDAAGVPGALTVFPPDSARATNPVLTAGQNGEPWLFHRGDSPLVPSQLMLAESDEQPASPSLLVPDAATIRQQAGGLTPVLAHAARHGLRGRFGDPQTYTEMRPDALSDDPTLPTPFYTQRTIAVYMRQSPFGNTVTKDEIARLLQVLNRFKPINLRIALVIAPDPLVEFLYPPGADILESWFDNVPLAEAFGAILDSTSATIPGLAVLLANELASRSADTLDPITLLRRTWFPDLQ
ncbi:MAG: hypothetical protein ABIO86_21595 [Sphingomonas sp.]